MNTNSVIFIDSRVAGYQTIVATLPIETDWYLLDQNSNGVSQMQNILAKYTGLDSIQIFSHGSVGAIQIGSGELSNQNLADYQNQLAAIGSSLAETGDILLYGCNVAQSESGQNFIQQLAKITRADIAASSDLTGSTALGANWVLESSTGVIDAVTLDVSYDGLLAEISGDSSSNQLTGTSDNDTINGLGGNDTIDGQAGSDSIDGGAGNDRLRSSSLSGQHTLLGGVGNDNLSATGLVVSLDGGDGDDSLVASGYLNQFGSTGYVKDGTAILQGGSGNDNLYVYQYTSSTLSGGDGSDYLYVIGPSTDYRIFGSMPVTSSLQGDAGNDWLNANWLSSASLVGGEGSDNLSVSNTCLANLNGGADNDNLNVSFDYWDFSRYTNGDSRVNKSYRLDGGEGDDNLSVSGNAYIAIGQVTVTQEGGLGNDTLTVTERSAGDTGNNGQNYGITSASLDGGDGDDRLQVGGVLQATLTGGAGVDSFVLTAQQYRTLLEGSRTIQNSDNTNTSVTADPVIITDFKVGVGGDVLDYSDLLRNDTLRYDGSNPFGSGFLSLGQSETDTLLKFDADGASGTTESPVVITRLQNVVANTLVANNFNPNYSTDGSPAENLLLNGTSLNEQLVGGFGNDTIYGGDGNDTLSDDQGSNLLEGGAGNDSLSSSSLSGQHTLLGGVGNDSLNATGLVVSLDGGEGDDSLNVKGQLNQSGSTSYVKDGTATLLGGSGHDNLVVVEYTSSTLSGGDGNDSLYVNGGWGQSYQTYGTFPVTSSLQGDTGNDWLDANWLSSASLVGGEGSDNLSVSNTRLANLDGGADNDTLNVNVEDWFTYSTDGDSRVTKSYSLDGGEGDDNLSVSGRVHIGYGQVTVTLEGGLGNDSLMVTDYRAGDTYYNSGQYYGITSVSLDGGDGDDRLEIGGVLQASLTGGAGVDTFVFTAQQYRTLLEGTRVF